jgi:hypothetical protein
MDPGPTEVFVASVPAAGGAGEVVRIPSFDLEANQTVTADFGTQGMTLESHPLTVALGAGETASVMTSVITPTGTYDLGSSPPISSPQTFQILPAGARRADDLFGVTVTTSATANMVFTSRSTTIRTKQPRTLAFELPPALDVSPPAVLTVPFLNPSFSFTNTAGALPLVSYVMRTLAVADNFSHLWTVSLSPSWVGAAASVQYAFPDLTMVPNFSIEFQLFDRTRIDWNWLRIEQDAMTGDGHITRGVLLAGSAGSYCGNGIVEPPETCEPPSTPTCSATCMKL